MFEAWSDAGSPATPVALPGFDTYAPRERYEAPRFAVMDDAQAAKWRDAVAQAKAINAAGADPLVRLRGVARTIVANLDRTFAALLQELQKHLQAADRAIDAARTDAKRAIALAEAAWKEFHDRLQQLEGKYGILAGDADLATALLDLRADVDSLVARAKKLADATQRAYEQLAAIAPAVATPLQSAAAGLADLADRILADVGKILGLFGESKRFLDAALAFGEEVLRLDVANVPKAARVVHGWRDGERADATPASTAAV